MQRLVFLLVMLCTLVGSAETVLQMELFSASFTNAYYTPGVQLCDTGTFHGTWGKVPDGAAVVAKDGKYMDCSTTGDGIVFTPSVISDKRTSTAMASVRVAGYDELSLLPVPTNARAAFAVHAPTDGQKANYVGWVCSKNCWTNLYPVSGASDIDLDEWREVMVRFLALDGANDGYIQYWLKRPTDSSYVPLKTADGVSWIRTGAKPDSGRLGKIGIFGDGGLERILGQEPRRGLIVGVGSWYDYQFTESIYRHSQDSGWAVKDDSARTPVDEIRSYVIDTEDGGQSVTYRASRPHEKETVEVTELEVQFTSVNDDESIPEDACARVRLVETPDETCRFACLADGHWKTNMNWVVDVDAKYTVEISLLRMSDDQKFVSYRYKEGYGLEGGAYRDLFLNEPMLPGASGKTLAIDFDGYGVVHEIRNRDRSK